MAKALDTVDNLLHRVNGLDDGDLKPILFRCLSSATTQLIAAIKTKSLDATVGVTEDFEIPATHPYNSMRFVSLRLHNGFVNQITNAVTLSYGENESNLTAVELEAFKVDEEKGLIIFDTTRFQESLINIYRNNTGTGNGRYSGLIFRVTYDHGFDSSTTALGAVYKNVPEWLKEAALIKAREVYQLTNKKKGVDPKDNSLNLSMVLDSYIRYYPLSIKPVY